MDVKKQIELLEKKLKIVNKERSGISEKLEELRTSYKNLESREYLGKYYKFPNQYDEEHKWWLYYKILKWNGSNSFLVDSFEKSSDEEIDIKRTTLYLSILKDTCIEITKDEYDNEFKKILKEVDIN